MNPLFTTAEKSFSTKILCIALCACTCTKPPNVVRYLTEQVRNKKITFSYEIIKHFLMLTCASCFDEWEGFWGRLESSLKRLIDEYGDYTPDCWEVRRQCIHPVTIKSERSRWQTAAAALFSNSAVGKESRVRSYNLIRGQSCYLFSYSISVSVHFEFKRLCKPQVLESIERRRELGMCGYDQSDI